MKPFVTALSMNMGMCMCEMYMCTMRCAVFSKMLSLYSYGAA